MKKSPGRWRCWSDLPGFAPDLNPIEMHWSDLKHERMANFVPSDVMDLERVVQAQLAWVEANSERIRSLWSGSNLPFLDRKFTI